MRVRVPPGVPYGSLAQLAEHLAVNQGVAGSSPAGIAIAGETWSVEWRMPTLKRLPSLCQGMRPTGGYIGPAGCVRWGLPRRRPGLYRGRRGGAGLEGIAHGTVLVIGSRPAWKAGVPSGGLQVRVLLAPPFMRL